MHQRLRTLPSIPRSVTILLATVSLLVAGACATETPQEAPTSDEIDEMEEAVDEVGEEVADLEQAVDETAAAAREFAYTEQEDFEAWVETRMQDIDANLESLDTRIAELGEDARSEWEPVQQELEQQRRRAEERVEEAMNATEQMWSEASTQATSTVQELGNSVADALERLTDNDR